MLEIANAPSQGPSLCSEFAEHILQQRAGLWPDCKHPRCLECSAQSASRALWWWLKGARVPGSLLAGDQLAAAPWYAQYPPCTKWHTSPSILVMALVMVRQHLLCARMTGQGGSGMNNLNSSPPPPLTNHQSFFSGTR